MNSSNKHIRGLIALTPLIVFMISYLAVSLITGDFYKMPISVAFLIASIYAVAITRNIEFSKRIEHFSAGASNQNVMLMIWIFVLAGAFAESARAMGAVDATVAMTMHLLPAKLLPAGLFIAACFVSISVGTSVGTVVALVPVAAGLAEQTSLNPAWLTAIVVGGAFFGDNLSFISDTTIAATRTQGCELKDKFRVNIRIVAPAALITLCIYLFTATNVEAPTPDKIEGIKILPYLLVLITAIAGLNVMKVLTLGIVTAGIIGIATDSFGALEWCTEMGKGITGMGELIIITMLAGGLLELIRINGGIDYLINLLTRHIHGRRGAEASIAAMVCMANLCTANNTIAILTVGPIARDISERYQIDHRRSASLLDTFSCLTQGVLPYGAQLLMAAGLTGLSPLNIIGYLYYPMIMGACAVLAIIFRYPRKF
ncbi:MAG: Na+/H+ antiporter NhaC family protein [Rikenellaceae bacterium]|nr:Na+/H+ antiporter NhaC family protein [Rikenellaceae bacterium]